MDNYLKETPLLNFFDSRIQKLISERKWRDMEMGARVKSIYNFVRDEVRFGYNRADEIPATEVLADGYGQCNTKSTLLMALLRGAGLPCRLHGFTIHKALQKGAINGIWYRLAPRNILHAWTEVYLGGEWFHLEGVILDKPYLQALQETMPDCKSDFCGYGAFTKDFLNPQVDFDYNHTYIQERGINQDFGLFDSPDEFYALHGQAIGPVRRWIFKHVARPSFNRNVRRIRGMGK